MNRELGISRCDQATRKIINTFIVVLFVRTHFSLYHYRSVIHRFIDSFHYYTRLVDRWSSSTDSRWLVYTTLYYIAPCYVTKKSDVRPIYIYIYIYIHIYIYKMINANVCEWTNRMMGGAPHGHSFFLFFFYTNFSFFFLFISYLVLFRYHSSVTSVFVVAVVVRLIYIYIYILCENIYIYTFVVSWHALFSL